MTLPTPQSETSETDALQQRFRSLPQGGGNHGETSDLLIDVLSSHGDLERRVREAEAENKRISELHKGLMAEADRWLEAAERRAQREGMSANEVVLSEKFMAQMRKNYSIDKNGDPVGAKPNAGWETGYAAGIRCFYRTLRDIYAAAPKEQEEEPDPDITGHHEGKYP